jgi:hypothetical protein
MDVYRSIQVEVLRILIKNQYWPVKLDIILDRVTVYLDNYYRGTSLPPPGRREFGVHTVEELYCSTYMWTMKGARLKQIRIGARKWKYM